MWSVAELEAILDALPARVSWWGSDLRLRYLNAAAARSLGVPRAAALSRLLPDFLGAEWAEASEYVERALAGVPQQFERVADGSHSDVYLSPMSAGILVFSQDATARVQAQAQARANDAQAALQAERQRIAAELGGTVIDGMDATKDLLTRAAAEPDLRDQAAARLDDVIASLRTTIRTLRGAPEPAPPPERPVLSTRLLKSVDRTDRAATASAGLSIHELLGVLDAIPAAVTAFDTGFYNTFANAAAVGAYDFGSRETIRGRQGAELLGKAAYEASLPYGEAAMAGNPQQFIRTLPDADASPTSTQIDYVAQIVDGTAVGAVALVVDVTSRVAAEDAARASVERLTVLADRARIAEDLHDLVIQRLFGAGLLVTATYGDAAANLALASECIDDAIAELRLSVHELHGDSRSFDLRAALDRVVRHASRSLGFSPTFRWQAAGGAAGGVATEIAVDVVAVVSEALSNAARHASPSSVEVRVDIQPQDLTVLVADDGSGVPRGEPRRSGLANLAARARRHGGRFTWRDNLPRGTVVEWSSPLP